MTAFIGLNRLKSYYISYLMSISLQAHEYLNHLWIKKKVVFKGTVSVISGEPPFKDGNAQLCVLKYESDINVYNFENWLLDLILLNLWRQPYLPHYWSDKGSRPSTVVNRVFLSFHEGSHKNIIYTGTPVRWRTD